MPDFDQLIADLPAAAEAIATGQITSRALIDACLARIERLEPVVQAFAWLDVARARRLAAEADRRQTGGERLGSLHGVPIGVKDILDTAGVPTEHGSPVYAGNVPSEDAGAVRALEAAGAIVIGKTVTTEFAYFHPGATTNPWDPTRTPGGSSMGSAAAVAAGMLPGAVGTQTNGSVIRPAAFCGVVGFKPTRGTIPVDGTLLFSETLDQVGCFARSVAGAARIAAAMAGHPTARWLPERAGGLPPRLAVARTAEWGHADVAMQRQFEKDLEALATAGAEFVEAPLPEGLEEAVPVHRRIMAAEAWRNLGALLSTTDAPVSQVLQAFVEEGRRIPDIAYQAALEERARLIESFATWMEAFDALVTPPTTGEASGPETTGDPRFCTRWTLMGTPALTLPTGLGPHGLPLGLQVVSAPGDDTLLLTAATWIEAQRPFMHRPPLAS